MKKLSAILAIVVATCAVSTSKATVLTAIPGPDDQGGMIMPMITLMGNALGVMFIPPEEPPILASLDHWSPGDTFRPSAAWYSALDPEGGLGDFFNNQYGFTFMGSIPTGKALGIRLTSTSSDALKFWNYVNNQNRFDEVFGEAGSQVLWNGSMWHNYVTLPADATPGIYTATFELFIANAIFTTGTGFADYSPNALSAAQDMGYQTVSINYSWVVVPEPSTYLLVGIGLVAVVLIRRNFRIS